MAAILTKVWEALSPTEAIEEAVKAARDLWNTTMLGQPDPDEIEYIIAEGRAAVEKAGGTLRQQQQLETEVRKVSATVPRPANRWEDLRDLFLVAGYILTGVGILWLLANFAPRSR
jgi:hypothetical protein